ncbi:Importin-4 [Nymphon striatum]|nr:Importin-4 [Nymphon striatum]
MSRMNKLVVTSPSHDSTHKKRQSYVRQTTAVLLRCSISKLKRWENIPDSIQNGKIVKQAIAQFIGIIAKYEWETKEWPEIIQYLQQSAESGDLLFQEVDNSLLLFMFHSLLYMLSLYNKACESFEFFNEIIGSEVTVLVPYIKEMIEICLKSVLKHKLINPILEVLFPLICTQHPTEDTNENDAFLTQDVQIPNVCAAQLKYVEPALQSSVPYHQRGGYVTIAVIAEGCSGYICRKYLKTFLQCVCKGITSEHLAVKNGALFALGQFAEHFQPDISKYASEIFPLLLEYLSATFEQLHTTGKDPPSLTKMFYALEALCENLGMIPVYLHCSNITWTYVHDDILPYLPLLMDKLMHFLTTDVSIRARELSISAIETLGTLSRSVESEDFVPASHQFAAVGLKLLDETTDPDLRRCIYGLFASISIVLKEQMNVYMEKLIEKMIYSLNLIEELTFAPFSVKCYQQLSEKFCYPVSNVAKAAALAAAQVLCSMDSVNSSGEYVFNPKELSELADSLIRELSSLITDDDESNVAMACLQAYTKLLNSSGKLILENTSNLEIITTSVENVMTHECGYVKELDEFNSAQDNSEIEMLLVEYALEVIPALAKACPMEQIHPYFESLLPHIISLTEKSCTVSEKSVSIGTLAEVIDVAKKGIQPFIKHLLPVFLKGMKDEDDEVRSNSVYGLGVLALHSGEKLNQEYPRILMSVSNMLSKEDCPTPLDNICGAIAKLILANVEIMPLKEDLDFLKEILLNQNYKNNSPYTFFDSDNSDVDYETMESDNETIDSYESDDVDLSEHEDDGIVSSVLGQNQLKPDTQNMVVQMLNELSQSYSELLSQAVSCLDQISLQILSAHFRFHPIKAVLDIGLDMIIYVLFFKSSEFEGFTTRSSCQCQGTVPLNGLQAMDQAAPQELVQRFLKCSVVRHFLQQSSKLNDDHYVSSESKAKCEDGLLSMIRHYIAEFSLEYPIGSLSDYG